METELSFQYKARYFKSGNITEATKQILFVFHGYGQLAKYFLRKFDGIANEETIVFAPEGLHHFYLEDINTRNQTKNNRVGATWMTRENRLMDIENYLLYLNTILDKELQQKNIPVTVLGFSQGAATATRWVLQGQVPFKKLILWAGIFPPDMDFDEGHEILKNKAVYHVVGDSDPFVTDERTDEMRYLCERLSIAPKQISFMGGHEIETATLQKVLEEK
jgi:predicted esterase